MITPDWKNASLESILFWNYAKTKIAYNTIEPLCFEGLLAGSEFLTYAANKLYFALEVSAASGGTTWSSTALMFTFHDEANAAFYYIHTSNCVWDDTAAAMKYFPVSVTTKNIYFSRLIGGAPTPAFKFVGYRLTIV